MAILIYGGTGPAGTAPQFLVMGSGASAGGSTLESIVTFRATRSGTLGRVRGRIESNTTTGGFSLVNIRVNGVDVLTSAPIFGPQPALIVVNFTIPGSAPVVAGDKISVSVDPSAATGPVGSKIDIGLSLELL